METQESKNTPILIQGTENIEVNVPKTQLPVVINIPSEALTTNANVSQTNIEHKDHQYDFKTLLCQSKGIFITATKEKANSYEIKLFKCDYEGQMEPGEQIGSIKFYDKLYCGTKYNVECFDMNNKLVFKLERMGSNSNGCSDIINTYDSRNTLKFHSYTKNKNFNSYLEICNNSDKILLTMGRIDNCCMKSNCGPYASCGWSTWKYMIARLITLFRCGKKPESIEQRYRLLRSYNIYEYMSQNVPMKSCINNNNKKSDIDKTGLDKQNTFNGELIQLLEYINMNMKCCKRSQSFQFNFPAGLPSSCDQYEAKLAYLNIILYLFSNKPVPIGYWIYLVIIFILMIVIILLFLKFMGLF